MQSEYPVSVLMVVPPWPGPVEQNPEPTTPTGPPRPAAAAATLSRYHGYIFHQNTEYSHLIAYTRPRTRFLSTRNIRLAPQNSPEAPRFLLTSLRAIGRTSGTDFISPELRDRVRQPRKLSSSSRYLSDDYSSTFSSKRETRTNTLHPLPFSLFRTHCVPCTCPAPLEARYSYRRTSNCEKIHWDSMDGLASLFHASRFSLRTFYGIFGDPTLNRDTHCVSIYIYIRYIYIPRCIYVLRNVTDDI